VIYSEPFIFNHSEARQSEETIVMTIGRQSITRVHLQLMDIKKIQDMLIRKLSVKLNLLLEGDCLHSTVVGWAISGSSTAIRIAQHVFITSRSIKYQICNSE